MSRESAIEKVKEYVSKGPDGKWTWEACVADVCTELGLDCGERAKECAKYATGVLRGIYPARAKSWEALNLPNNPIELSRIVGYIEMEVKFTLEKRTPPPKPEPAPKKDKEAKAEGEKADKGPKAPPPPKKGPPPPPTAAPEAVAAGAPQE